VGGTTASIASFWWSSAESAGVWWFVLSIVCGCGEVWSSQVAVKVVLVLVVTSVVD
jgi:hypothetical protein